MLTRAVQERNNVLLTAPRRVGAPSLVLAAIGWARQRSWTCIQFGVTSMSLAIGAFVGRLTQSIIRNALTTVTTKTLGQWEQTYFGSTIPSQRKQAFSSGPGGTKTGSNQLALTRTN